MDLAIYPVFLEIQLKLLVLHFWKTVDTYGFLFDP